MLAQQEKSCTGIAAGSLTLVTVNLSELFHKMSRRKLLKSQCNKISPFCFYAEGLENGLLLILFFY